MTRAEEAWAVYEYREHPKGLYYTCYIDGYKQAERDLAMSYPMPEDTILFQKGVEEGRRLEREEFSWVDVEHLYSIMLCLDKEKYPPMSVAFYKKALEIFSEDRQ